MTSADNNAIHKPVMIATEYVALSSALLYTLHVKNLLVVSHSSQRGEPGDEAIATGINNLYTIVLFFILYI